MPVQSDFYNAFTSNPNGPDPVLLRDALRKRTPYALTALEDSQQLIATDPITGAVIEMLAQNGKVYQLDRDDSTSVHDGSTTLVTYDGLVYKLSDLQIPYSVISKSYTSPPASPILGDAYLLVGAGSGDWAGKGPLVVLTSWGWVSLSAPPGRLIYVEDEDGYYHIDRYGNAIPGFGSSALSNNSVLVRHFLGGGRSFHFSVVNATTNNPPTLSGSGNQYIVGSAPTGAWAGKAGWIAIDEGIAWGLYQPTEGWRAYNIALDGDFRYDGSAWVSLGGALLFFDYKFTQAALTLHISGGTAYTYSVTTAPTTSQSRGVDPITISRAARQGSRLRIKYRTNNAMSGEFLSTVALFRDAEANAIGWDRTSNNVTIEPITYEWIVTAPDASSHTYSIAFYRGSSTSDLTCDHRLLSLEEFAP